MKKNGKRMQRLCGILASLTLLSFSGLGSLYARYVTEATGVDSARVAAFQITEQDDLAETYVLYPELDGEAKQEIRVTMENKSETAVRYLFSIETEGSLPLQIEAGGPEGAVPEKQEENCWMVERPAGPGEAEKYLFLLSLPDEADNYRYAGGVESLRLTIRAEQTD